jgi:CRISPR-associated endonuclease Cas1
MAGCKTPTERVRLAERARDHRQAPASLRRRGQVCIVHGWGVRVTVHRGRLAVSDGVGRQRKERCYSRAEHGLARLVVIGSAGSVSLEALRWLADVGIGFLHLDRDGRLLTHSADLGVDDPRLRRAQAFAVATPTGLQVARCLLSEKLSGQRDVARHLPGRPQLETVFENAAARLDEATTIDELVYAERDAALAYWNAWRAVEVRFRAADIQRVPQHWLSFGQRVSPLTKSPRLAGNPANAILNYLYAILEAETRIACLAVGLDPGLGIVHADYRARDSLALDLMEPIRPHVDRYVLDLIHARRSRAADFYETRKGSCRILAPLSHELAQTSFEWATLIAPVVEHTARLLAEAPESRIDRLSTPLTGAKRSARQTRRRSPAVRSTRPPTPKPPAECRRCGDPVPRRGRVYCDDCLPHYQREQYATAFHGSGLRAIDQAKTKGNDPTHGATAADARAASNVERKRDAREWDERYGKLTDLSAFQREILPLIQDVPLSRLQSATGLSLRYVSLIRRGEKTPHPRHWASFAAAGQPPTPRASSLG